MHRCGWRWCGPPGRLIYADTALGTRLVERFGARMPASSTSQPSLVADMLELLAFTPIGQDIAVPPGGGC